jgi:prepilin-type N-terminal cleavage/methylation domain-containing protein
MKNGFTFIELLVAVTIFVVVVAVASGIFVQTLRTQREVIALMAANDNASLTLEQMVREIRTGRQFQSNNRDDRLEFINIRGEPVVYETVGNVILRNGQPLTASNVKVNYLLFGLQGEAPEDGLSTRVTINLGVGAVGRSVSGFVTNLQTTVAARLLDA